VGAAEVPTLDASSLADWGSRLGSEERKWRRARYRGVSLIGQIGNIQRGGCGCSFMMVSGGSVSEDSDHEGKATVLM